METINQELLIQTTTLLSFTLLHVRNNRRPTSHQALDGDELVNVCKMLAVSQHFLKSKAKAKQLTRWVQRAHVDESLQIVGPDLTRAELVALSVLRIENAKPFSTRNQPTLRLWLPRSASNMSKKIPVKV